MMAPCYELCCLSLPQFYCKSHDAFYSLTQDNSYALSASSAHLGMTFSIFFYFESNESKIEKVPRGIQGEKSSKNMASSRNLVSTIGAQVSPTNGDGTRCPEG